MNIRNKWIYILLFLPHFKPAYFDQVPLMDNIFNFARIISAAIILTLYFIRGKYSKIILLISLLQISLLVSTIINKGDLFKLAISSFSIIVTCMLLEIGILTNVKVLIRAIFFLLGFLIFINFITIILYPNGMYQTLYKDNYFLGYDNIHITIILPAISIGLLKIKMEQKQFIMTTLILVTSFISIYLRWSATSVFGVTLFLLFIIFYKLKITKKFGITSYIVINIAIFLLVVILSVQNIFTYLIVDLLHKDLTFTGRTFIWDKALMYIKDSMIWGNGVENPALTFDRLGVFHAHNFYLDLMYRGGVIALTIFIIILFVSGKKFSKFQGNDLGTIISFTIFDFLVIFQVEAYQYMPLFYGIIIMAYHIDSIIFEYSNTSFIHRLKSINVS